MKNAQGWENQTLHENFPSFCSQLWVLVLFFFYFEKCFTLWKTCFCLKVILEFEENSFSLSSWTSPSRWRGILRSCTLFPASPTRVETKALCVGATSQRVCHILAVSLKRHKCSVETSLVIRLPLEREQGAGSLSPKSAWSDFINLTDVLEAPEELCLLLFWGFFIFPEGNVSCEEKKFQGVY